MTASSRGRRAMLASIRASRPQNALTASTTFRRTYSLAIVTSTSLGDDNIPSLSKIRTEPTASTKTHNILAGVILSRPPLLTPALSSFEKAFFFYQKRLNERLAIPFTRYFYFKKDTPGDTDWKLKALERGGVIAKELGTYKAQGKDGWNDELLVKDKEMVEPYFVRDCLLKDAKISVTEDGVVVKDVDARAEGLDRPRERWTEADRTKDVRRLDRKLDRTLYLVVKNQTTLRWVLPIGNLVGRENLHQAAERIIVQSCGINMNTWIVGHTPIAHQTRKPQFDDSKTKVTRRGEKTFFMKGRIMAGQVNLQGNILGWTDWKWLTREELERALEPDVFSAVADSLHDR